MTPPPPEPCPPRDLLIEAAAPESDSTVRERVADHLVDCAQCAEDYRLLRELAEWAPTAAHLLAESDNARPRPRTMEPPRATESPLARLKPRATQTVVFAYAAAAVLAIVAVALTVDLRRLQRENQALAARVAQIRPVPPQEPPRSPAPDRSTDPSRIAELERRLGAAEAPDLNAPIIDLEPADALRSVDSSPPPIRIPATARQVVFVLNSARPTAGTSYDVEIADEAGRVVWSGTGLTQTKDGTLTLVVPRAMFGSPSRIRLYARSPNGRALVEQYVFRTQP